MSDPIVRIPDPLMPLEDLLTATRDIVNADLKPQTVSIDLDGHYPEDVLRKLGPIGAYIYRMNACRPVSPTGARTPAAGTCRMPTTAPSAICGCPGWRVARCSVVRACRTR